MAIKAGLFALNSEQAQKLRMMQGALNMQLKLNKLLPLQKKTKEADVQAAKPTPLTIDVAVQAGRQQQSLQLPPQAEQALRLPPVVKDVFCPDENFSMASWAEHEHERCDRDHQCAEDRRQDLSAKF